MKFHENLLNENSLGHGTTSELLGAWTFIAVGECMWSVYRTHKPYNDIYHSEIGSVPIDSLVWAVCVFWFHANTQ